MPRNHAERFTNAIHRHGKPARWFRGMDPTNYHAKTGYSDPNADIIIEHGFVYIQQTIDNPEDALTAGMADDGIGNLSAGSYAYAVTFVTAFGETEPSPVATATVVTPSTDGKVSISNIPVVSGDNSVALACTARRLYRSLPYTRSIDDEDPVQLYLLAEIADNETTTYTDNIADDDLGAEPPARNTTYPIILITGWRKTLQVGGDIGVLKIANARVLCDRNECPVTRCDKFIGSFYNETWRETVAKGDDTLTRPFVAEIRQIFAGAVNYVQGVDYELGTDRASVEWLGGGDAPADDTIYSIEYTYEPAFYFMGDDATPSRQDEGGDWMLMRGTLVEKHPSTLGLA